MIGKRWGLHAERVTTLWASESVQEALRADGLGLGEVVLDPDVE